MGDEFKWYLWKRHLLTKSADIFGEIKGEFWRYMSRGILDLLWAYAYPLTSRTKHLKEQGQLTDGSNPYSIIQRNCIKLIASPVAKLPLDSKNYPRLYFSELSNWEC